MDWLARGELRQRLARLDQAAGRSVVKKKANQAEARRSVGGISEISERSRSKNGKLSLSERGDDEGKDDGFSDNFIRWAKLPPSLEGIDLSPYLHLAASFAGASLIDAGLPNRLRDIAASLLSSSRASQKSVTDADIRGLPAGDVEALIEHLGRMARDRPGDVLAGVGGILRVARLADGASVATKVLTAFPAKEIKAPVILLFGNEDARTYEAVLERWAAGTRSSRVKKAVAGQLGRRAVS